MKQSELKFKNSSSDSLNPCGVRGIAFVEFAPQSVMTPKTYETLFTNFGFSKTLEQGLVDGYVQNSIYFLVNGKSETFAGQFAREHGPSICSMGWMVDDPEAAFKSATSRGAEPAPGDYSFVKNGKKVPAIYGIGGSIVYFVNASIPMVDFLKSVGFKESLNPNLVPEKGFMVIDHLTNNVHKGTMQKWANFYKEIFGFTEVRYFDIRGAKTGLVSYALKSPDGSFCIPINEGTESESQINEYLREYKGAGIQHLAFLTDDILGSLEKLQGTGIETLDMDEEYYQEAFQRVPQVSEDRNKIKAMNVLVDGDDEGYLLQIFTKNIVGPIFIEIIQRKNHYSFGEGNFGALFRSIERDQMKRGVV